MKVKYSTTDIISAIRIYKAVTKCSDNSINILPRCNFICSDPAFVISGLNSVFKDFINKRNLRKFLNIFNHSDVGPYCAQIQPSVTNFYLEIPFSELNPFIDIITASLSNATDWTDLITHISNAYSVNVANLVLDLIRRTYLTDELSSFDYSSMDADLTLVSQSVRKSLQDIMDFCDNSCIARQTSQLTNGIVVKLFTESVFVLSSPNNFPFINLSRVTSYITSTAVYLPSAKEVYQEDYVQRFVAKFNDIADAMYNYTCFRITIGDTEAHSDFHIDAKDLTEEYNNYRISTMLSILIAFNI
jgi:hypothetical protein